MATFISLFGNTTLVTASTAVGGHNSRAVTGGGAGYTTTDPHELQLLRMAAASPLSPVVEAPPNLWEWWTPDRRLPDGTSVASWAGALGKPALTNGVAGNRPTKQTVNGASVMRFDGAGDHLQGAVAGFPTAPYTVFITARYRSARVGNDTLLDGANYNCGRVFRSGVATLAMHAGLSAPSVTNDLTTSFSVYSFVFNGASSAAKVAGGADNSGNVGAGVPLGLTLGAAGNGGESGPVDIRCVAVCTGALTLAERQAFEATLSIRKP